MSATPAYSDVDLIGSASPSFFADPWIITQQTTLGSTQATFLDVHNGGTVDATGASFLILGDGFDSTVYVQVDVRDAGSSLSAKNLVLNPSTVTRVFVDTGGAVTVNDDFYLDSTLGSINSAVAVSGSGSQLSVGDNVSLQELIVADGATVLTGTSMGNTDAGDNAITTRIYDATLRGAGSTWTDHNSIQVLGTLSIEDGAHLTSTLEPTILGNTRFRLSGSGNIHLHSGSLTAQEIARNGAGRLHLHSGTLTLNQSGLTVGSNGLMGDTVRIDPSSTIDVSGEVVVDAGSELFIEGALVSSGLTNNGSLILRDATLDQAVTSAAGSTIDVLGNATFNGLVSGAGGIFGSGTATFNGGYNPGDSPAVVPIATDLALGAAGELSIELAGTDHGAFDQLSVAGDVSLDGTLGVSLIDGFALSPGQQFTIVDIAGESTGQFAGLPEGALVGNFGGVDVSISYAAGDGNNVALFARAVPEPASAALLALAFCVSNCVRVRRRPSLGQRGISAFVVCGFIFGGLGASPSWADIQLVGDVGAGATPSGVARFDGPWNTAGLQVGLLGPGQGLVAIGNDPASVPGGDTVEVDGIIRVGVQVPGTLLVAGTNALLTSGGTMQVGLGARGLLLASGGATVETGDAEVGGDPGVGIGKVEISGSGTTWDHYDLDINAEGELRVVNGAVAETENFAAIVGHIEVTGPGSVWTAGALNMLGSAASIVISDGAQMNVRGEFFQDFFGDPVVFVDDFGLRLNSGSIVIQGGTLSTNFFGPFTPGNLKFEHGTLDLSASGLVVGDSGLLGDAVQIDSGSVINLSDEVTIEAGATMAVAGTLTSSAVTNHGGLTFTSTTLDAPVTNLAGSTMDVIGDVVLGGMVSGDTDLFGSGTIHFAGGYQPGDGAALVSIEGSAVFTESNTLFLEIGGTTPGVDHDRLEVGGFTTLAGTLDVTLLDGFIPELGDSFAVLFSSGGFDADFSALTLPDLSAEGLDWELNPGGATLFLEAVPALDGDYNLDGMVDAADYTVWRDGLGTTFTPGDYDVWKANFGVTAAAAAAVPEPAAGILLLFAGLGYWISRSGC